LLIAICLLSFQTGCRKKRAERPKKTAARLSESTKNIKIEDLLPKNNVVTGKLKREIPEKIINEYMYGTLAGQYGKVDTAEEYLLKTIKMEPLFVDAHHNLGLAYYKQGRIDEAVKCWRKTLELAPNYAEAYYNLSIFMMALGRTDDAIKLLDVCTQYEPFHLKARRPWQDSSKERPKQRSHKAFQSIPKQRQR